MPRPRLFLVLVLALVVAACGSTAPSSGATGGPEASAPTTGPATATPGDTGTPLATDEVPTDEIPTDEVPTDEPVPTEPGDSLDPGDSASPDASASPAGACSGSQDNRDFFASVAVAVDWTVLCAVLPKGWYVSTGSYRLANGGRLVISYKGPAGATVALSEGAFCADESGCVPSGTDGDDVPLGPLTGTLVRLDDGGFVIVADRGQNPSWLLQTSGVDEATALAFAAALFEVAG